MHLLSLRAAAVVDDGDGDNEHLTLEADLSLPDGNLHRNKGRRTTDQMPADRFSPKALKALVTGADIQNGIVVTS